MRELSLYNITITCIEIPEVLPPQCEENLCFFFYHWSWSYPHGVVRIGWAKEEAGIIPAEQSMGKVQASVDSTSSTDDSDTCS